MRLILRNRKLNFFSHLALIAFSFYLSFVIFLGGVLGYLSIKYFAKKATIGSKTKKGYLRLLILNFKNHKIHLHHWVNASVALVLYLYFSHSDSHFIISFMGGIIAEDFLCDKNFYKVFLKKNRSLEKSQ